MTKRKIIKLLKQLYTTKKRSDRSHDIIVVSNDQDYHIKILNTQSNSQLTINSQTIWELKRGKISGLRFVQTSSQLVDIGRYIEKKNRIVILTNKPYKILRYINESEVVDISDSNAVYGTKLIKSIEEINALF